MASVLKRLRDVEVLGFVDHTKSVDWIYESGCRTMNLLTKGSEKQCKGQLKKTLEQHLEDIKKTVAYAHEKGMDVNVYLEDWSTGMLESPDYVIKMISILKDLKGIKRIMLPDTLGKLPAWKTKEFIEKVKDKFPEVHFDYHAHNDYGLAVANSLEALKACVNGIHTTVNGLGERAGNCQLSAIAVSAKDHLNIDLGLNEIKYRELSKLIEIASKIRVSPNTPIDGSNAFTQTAGVHADGDDKGEVYHTKLNEQRFGGDKKYAYALGKQAGYKSVKLNLEAMGIEAENDVIRSLTNKVRKIGEQKANITQEDLYFLYLDEIGKSEEQPFQVLDCRADVSFNGAKTGYIKVRLNGNEYEETGIGDGGYDAIMNALGKIVNKQNIPLPELADYDPRIPPGGGTSALVEAIIEWKNGYGTFRTTGIDPDQTIAAVKATEKMVNIVLLRNNH